MIKFFRKIRYDLMEKNKTGKYLKYAIGEIVLVVIGILIALSINTWNETKKMKLEEIKILNDFQVSLQRDIYGLNRAMTTNMRTKQSMIFLLDYFKKDLPYNDSLKYHFGNTNFQWSYTISSGVFDALKSRGLDLISNDSLKQEIITVFSWTNGSFRDDQERYRDVVVEASKTIYNTRFDQYWKDNYETWKNKNSYDSNYTINDIIPEMVPLDFEKLKKDTEYLYFLKSLLNQYNWFIESQSNGMLKILIELVNDIDKELKKLNK